jgi:hypothetical protein
MAPLSPSVNVEPLPDIPAALIALPELDTEAYRPPPLTGKCDYQEPGRETTFVIRRRIRAELHHATLITLDSSDHLPGGFNRKVMTRMWAV